MMLVLAAAPLILASCDQLGIPNGDVSGTVTGTAPVGEGEIRMALRSITVSGVTNSNPDQVTLGTFNPAKKVYAISLPSNPENGAYDVFAYADKDNDKSWDVGETRTKLTGRGLIYSQNGNAVLNLKPGWTQVQGPTPKVVKSGTPFRDYNLSW